MTWLSSNITHQGHLKCKQDYRTGQDDRTQDWFNAQAQYETSLILVLRLQGIYK